MKAWISMVIMALVTYVPRALPLSIFQKEIKSTFIKSFLYYVPYCVLAAMTFPSIFYATGSTLSAAIGTAIACILAFFERSLLVVACTAVACVCITSLLGG